MLKQNSAYDLIAYIEDNVRLLNKFSDGAEKIETSPESLMADTKEVPQHERYIDHDQSGHLIGHLGPNVNIQCKI